MNTSSDEGQNLAALHPLRNLRRLEGWERRLVDYIGTRRRTPFAWRGNDCASFGIEAIRQITGEIIYPVTWSNALEAAREIAAAGGLAAALTECLGVPSGNWRVAVRGDVGLTKMNGRDAVVICTGASWCGPGLDGLTHLPLSAVPLVWRVG